MNSPIPTARPRRSLDIRHDVDPFGRLAAPVFIAMLLLIALVW